MQFKQRLNTNRIVVHCSATRATQDIGAPDIDRWHRARGFLAIGYHYVIRRDGTLEQGRPPNAVGSHAVGHNSNSIGICLVGGIDHNGDPQNNFTVEQFVELERLLKELKLAHPHAEVLGHRDIPGVAKACPSFDVRAWWAIAGK